MKKFNGGKKQSFVPAVVTIEFRIQKRNQIADLIQANSLLKEINEQIILARVKEIENTIYIEHAANVHLYSSKIEKVVSLFKGINQNNYINIAQKLKKQELATQSILKLLEKKKQLKDYDQDILNKTLQKSEYDPLNTKQISSKKTVLVANKITIVKSKNSTSDQKGNFAAQPNMVFAGSIQPIEPIQEKKVKIEKSEKEDDDEIDIRKDDGMQGASSIGVHCSKQLILFDSKIKIPVVLLVQFLPQYRVLCEKVDFAKLHNAKETIQFLSSNLERKIVFGQVILKPSEYTKNLRELSEKLTKQDKIVAQKFDKDNASFLILHKNQLEQILKARKQSLAFDASDMVIREWTKQQSYLEWWALNKQDHNLHFLISYKSLTNSNDQIYDKVILQKPSCYQKIQQTIDSLKQKKDIDDLLQGFLKQDLFQSSQLGDMLQEPNQIQQVDYQIQEEAEKVQQDLEKEQESNKQDDKFETNKISEQENNQINFNIKISDLTLQLSKEDYF
ncbi:unnamed protein product (macronuclear) [Paramecium tetraurelia]|uniref:Lon N-terminal domain-containing protein n=1 Tax=Paramecium tetraurelia TaxID=5888 RepID=A0BNI7_PARTE|nr:uncharacterized protein GSPATT00030742001 [Paramecium tetraurelia]CAK60104.1 unnamed protein product [Paramecium tetraurelia]|eukprot:XP_001427502.1 hypothetical protein (macronuclear) [Paramecium tetraurelia strain d4-2]